MGGRRWAIVVVVTLLTVPLPAPAHASTVGVDCASMNPFTADLDTWLAAAYPGRRFTASVLDERTGCQYDLHPDVRIGTASVLKVEIMAGILLRAQSEGRPLTDDERGLIDPMITQSANEPATRLWQSLGSQSGMSNLDDIFGMTDTDQTGPAWGLTTTSARDQVHLLRQVLLGDFGPFDVRYRADASDFMTRVVPEQRWGMTAGVPSDWTVALKNGFASSACCAWRINTTGVAFDPAGGSYVVAILSDGWPTDLSGVSGVETVSQQIAGRLAHSFTSPQYFLRDALSSGAADAVLTYGSPFDAPLVGDWNGDHLDTVGIDRRGVFFLRDAPGGGVADTSFSFGDAGDEVIVGDWDGDGRDTIGVRRGSTFYLRNANTTGPADVVFDFGDPADVVVVGDWNGDGTDTVGVVRGGHWLLRGTNTTGVADQTVTFGDPGDAPLTGDWDGDHVDTIGVRRGSEVFLRNQNSDGPADIAFTYGDPGDAAITGDWDGDGRDGIGVVRTRL